MGIIRSFDGYIMIRMLKEGTAEQKRYILLQMFDGNEKLTLIKAELFS